MGQDIDIDMDMDMDTDATPMRDMTYQPTQTVDTAIHTHQNTHTNDDTSERRKKGRKMKDRENLMLWFIRFEVWCMSCHAMPSPSLARSIDGMSTHACVTH